MTNETKQSQPLRKSPGSFHHGDLREATLLAATKVVEASGAEQLSVRSIARTLGVSDAAIYRHFSGRDDLLREVGKRGAAHLMQAVSMAMQDVDDPADRLLAGGRGYVRYAVEHPGWYRLFASRGFQESAWGEAEAVAESPEPTAPDLSADAPEPFRSAARAEHTMKRALAEFVPADTVDDHYRVLWGLAHGFAGLVIERLFRRCNDDAERFEAAERGLALHIDLLRRASESR